MGCVRRDHRRGGNTPMRWDLVPLPQICAEALYDIAELDPPNYAITERVPDY